MLKRRTNQPPDLAQQASWELKKLARMIRIVDRRGDVAVCQRLLTHARKVQKFVEDRRYSQALHVARCRMKG